VLGYPASNQDTPSDADSAASVPRSLVVAGEPVPRLDRANWSHTYADTVIYEVHVKGFTMRHPGIPAELRGTFAGLGHEAAITHLIDLGVTAVELLPVHESIPEAFLVQRGLTNYWGYNTIGYFAPSQAYSAAVRAGSPGGQVTEFKAMVDALHAAGIEVLLDVVFNHTAEGNHLGPTLCYRGLDNPAYYRLDGSDPRHYVDTTGCGNSLNAGDPVTLQLIMDSLRYWLTDMHVDGFRFDLAPALARQEGEFEMRSAFFDLVSQDPVVSRAKLIAEPWDVGQMDSYDLGRFPPVWREWNGKYRDTMRDFWRSHPVGLGEFAARFCGSSDMYARARRRPTASVNLITVHDGFTLHDLVSYDAKHNEANGEANHDGTDDNRSWNCGAEGPTDDPAVLALRAPVPGDAHHVAALLRHPDAARRRRDGPHPAGQQQRLLPGQRDHLVRLVTAGHWPAGLHQAADRVAPSAPGVPPQPVPGRSRGSRAALVYPGGHRNDRRQLVRPEPPGDRALPGRIR
jgi:isoamylase